MKTRRYSEAQVFRILKEVDSGVAVVDTVLGSSDGSRVVVPDAWGAEVHPQR